MRVRTAVVAVGLVAGLLLGGGCEKTKTDQGIDLMEQMIDLWVDGVEQLFDIVDDNIDICGKCVRDVEAMTDQHEAQMRALFSEWNRLKASSTTKESRDAVEAVKPRVEEAMKKIGKLQETGLELFEKHNKHCVETIGSVLKCLERLATLFERVAGHEF